MKSLLVVLVLAVVVIAQDKEETNAVLQLLADLRNNASNELRQLEEAWAERASRKQFVVDTLGKSVQQQKYECQRREEDVKSKQEDIDNTNQFIEWMNKRSASNTERTTKLDDNNCHRTNNYVNDIKNDKVALSLIQFLKRELKNLDADSLSLTQTNDWSKRVQKFVDLYKSGNLYAMIQVNMEDSDAATDNSEIEQLLTLEGGDDNVDVESEPQQQEDISELEVTAFTSNGEKKKGSTISNTRDELVQLLDNFEVSIRENLDHSQSRQVNTALTFIDYRNAVERENETYERHIKEEQDSLTRLSNQLTNRKQAASLCQNRLTQITQAYQVSAEDVKASKVNYEELVAQKKEELKVFEEVYRIYVNQVASG